MYSKLDAVDRFWTSVEPYCGDITSNDMTVLYDNNMMVAWGWGSCSACVFIYCLQHDEEQEYYKIPSLGKHYSHKWAMAEMQKEEQQSDWLQEISDKKPKDKIGDGMY